MSLDQPIKGIIGVCLTPFNDNDRVDYSSLEREIDFIVPDCNALSIGTEESSEYRMLSFEERKELMERATEIVGNRLPVILGISSPSVHQVVELADHSANIGADLVHLLMPQRPWGGRPNDEELVEYFTLIASASPLPIMVNHDPGTGADVSVAAIVQLSEVNNIKYFKDSSCNISRISRITEEIELAGKGLFFTTMQPLLAALTIGASGASMPPPATRIGAQVVKYFNSGHTERARNWQRCFALFPGKWADYGLPPVMKSAMKHMGVNMGNPARPYSPVSPRDDAQIGQFFREMGLLGEIIPDSPGLTDTVAGLPRGDTTLR
jgi:4-hydroxy-tetrahydrodipicolinate synthase